jgi:hypothetical protein
VPDAGNVDGGSEDSGVQDSGVPDSGGRPGDAGLDAGADAGSTMMDAGTPARDAGPDAGCGTYTSSISASGGGRGVAVEVAGAPRFLFHDTIRSMAEYSECTQGCNTATPTLTTPLAIGAMGGTSDLLPALVELTPLSPTLIALWRSQYIPGGVLEYAECAGSCSASGSWSTIAIPAIGSNLWDKSAAGLATLNGLRAAAATQTPSADAGTFQAVYAECSSSCTSAAFWSSTVVVPSGAAGGGAAIALTASGGTTLRTAVWGDLSGALAYAECSATCTQAASWTTAILEDGAFPAMVMDQNGLPRIFHLKGEPPGPLSLTRCVARPCTDVANWTSVGLSDAGGYPSAGTLPGSGLTYVASDNGTNLLVGVDDGSGTYAMTPLDGCGAPVAGISPSGYASGDGGWRFIYDGPSPPTGSQPVLFDCTLP